LHLPYYYPLSQPDRDEGKRDWLEDKTWTSASSSKSK
jgi:hypothetical protein